MLTLASCPLLPRDASLACGSAQPLLPSAVLVSRVAVFGRRVDGSDRRVLRGRRPQISLGFPA